MSVWFAMGIFDDYGHFYDLYLFESCTFSQHDIMIFLKNIQDIGFNACKTNPDKQCSSNGTCGGTCKSVAPANSVRMVFGNVQWIKAADYPDLLSLLQQHSGQKIRLMGANTGTGKYLSRHMGKPTICLGEIKGTDQLRSNLLRS